MLERSKVPIFDEATSNLEQSTAEQFAKTVNLLKGKRRCCSSPTRYPRD
jgi:subfamily B ATP-binding cassette protein HlyB/CyaB